VDLRTGLINDRTVKTERAGRDAWVDVGVEFETRRGRRALLRFAFGNAQMFSAVVAGVLMFRDGVTTTTLVAVATACCVTLVSRIVFARDPNRWGAPPPLDPPLPTPLHSSPPSPHRPAPSNVPPVPAATRSLRP
jgi:hypothetical protein